MPKPQPTLRRIVAAALSGPAVPLLVVFLCTYAPARLYAESAIPDTGSESPPPPPPPCFQVDDPGCYGLMVGDPCVIGTAKGGCRPLISCAMPDGAVTESLYCVVFTPPVDEGGTTLPPEGGASEDPTDDAGATPGSRAGGCSVGSRAAAGSDLVPLAGLGIGLALALRRRRRLPNLTSTA